MLRSCYKGLGKCLGLSNSDGLLWHSDLKQHASGEFSIAVVQANSTLEDQSQVITTPNTTYVGVFDGHGGPEASRFVNKYLFSFLHSKPFFTPLLIFVFLWGLPFFQDFDCSLYLVL